MPRILVSPLSAVPACLRLHAPSHVITLLSPEYMIETLEDIEQGCHLRLGVDDVADASAAPTPPTEQHVARLLDFARTWDARSPILVHCWAGISRSMAAAYSILCDRAGPGSERKIAREIRARAPHADPNGLIVEHADKALGRNGRMVSAVREMGRGTIATEGVLVSFPLESHAP